MIRVNAQIELDEREIQEDFVRASGPGGQNVNKVSTAVQLRFDVAHSPSLPDLVRAPHHPGRSPRHPGRRADHRSRTLSQPTAQPHGFAKPLATQTLNSLRIQKIFQKTVLNSATTD